MAETPASSEEQLDAIVSRYVAEVRDGVAPDVDTVCAAHPDLADELRELLPLVARLERWGTAKEVECVRQSLPIHFPLRELGEYRLIRELGRGGMGVVFQAEHRFSSRSVALKLLPFRLGADLSQRQAQFRREADAISQLRHPHIVPIYSFGEETGFFYYVMQLIEGVTLSEIIQRLRESDEPIGEKYRSATRPAAMTLAKSNIALRRDSWLLFAKFGVQIAEALVHAHAAGILHNDIKPANIMLDAAGRVVVTDFSGSGLRDELPQDEQTPALGTLRYMAPERFLRPGDARSDLYSLGITLYELLTQAPAIAVQSVPEMMAAIREGNILPPYWHAPSLPAGLVTILEKSMHPDPDRRYPTALKMRDDLVTFLGQPRARRQHRKWWRQWP